MRSRRTRAERGPAAIGPLPDDEKPAVPSRPATSEIIAAALSESSPAAMATASAPRRRFQEALIACRAGETADRDARLRAAFSLYAEDLMTRGEIREMFRLTLWEFSHYQQRFLPRSVDGLHF